MFEKDDKVTGLLNCSDSVRTEREEQAGIKCMNGHSRQCNQKMHREVTPQELILYLVQSLRQSVGLLFYLSSSFPGKRMLTMLSRTLV